MNYPVVLHKDRDSDYGVTVPDLPGCFSAGKSVDEALAMAREAIELHLEGLIDEGQQIPPLGSIQEHQHNPVGMLRYCFSMRLFHPLLHAGFDRRFP